MVSWVISLSIFKQRYIHHNVCSIGMSRWLSEKLGDYIVNCEKLLMTISEGRVNLKHTISQRNTQAIQDLLVGIYFLVHSRTYTSVESAVLLF